MRYFAELSYKGTNYCGYQIQPNGISIQETLEKALSTILNKPTVVVGCGRTDTGVHASQYFIHFEAEKLPEAFVQRLNKFIPKDIAIHRIFPVADDLHTRFDAQRRSYEYRIDYRKSPFNFELAYFYYAADQLDLELMNKAGAMLLEYKEFTPFCKTKSDAKTMFCDLSRAEWVQENGQLVFHISANRFLRGMVRLIVGACLQIGLGQLTLEDLRTAMEEQKILKKALSAPAQGLYLSKIEYPGL